MSASERIGHHLRANVIGYLALFVALTGTSYAATQITSKQIAKNAVKAKHIKDGQVQSAEVADNGLTGADIDESTLQNVPVLLADGSVTTIKLADQAVTIPKLAFDPATQGELDALGTAGTINSAGNPIDFSKLKNVPADFADGVDNTGAAPANNSLGAAEPPATDDQIVDGSIDSQDLTPNVALLDEANQTFAAPLTIDGNTLVSVDGATEQLGVSATRAAAGFTDNLLLTLTNNSTGGGQDIAEFANAAGSNATESLLRLNNLDSDTAATSGLTIESLAGGITTAITASDAEIVTALDIGANDIKTSGATISAAELEKLDGTTTRDVNLPLASFFNVTDNATLDFTASDGTSPDFVNASGLPVIEWDADTDGGGANIADIDSVATQFIVPPDYESAGRIRLTAREFSTAGASEQILCDAAGTSGGFGATDDFNLNGVPAVVSGDINPVVTYVPGATIVLRCHADDTLGGTTANDVVRLHSASFRYTAAY